MRTALLLTALVTLAACNDDQAATAPGVSRSATAGVAAPGGAVRESGQLAAAQGKPLDAVGFTKVINVWSTPVTIAAGGFAFPYIVCPTGTTVVSGGFHYEFPNGVPSVSPPSVLAAYVSGNGYQLHLVNYQSGAISWQVVVRAVCVS